MNFRKVGNIVPVLNLHFSWVYTTLNPATKQIFVSTVPSFSIFLRHHSSPVHLWLSNFKRALCKKNKTKQKKTQQNRKIQWNFNFSKYFKINNTII